jgi:hypothetical protein
VQNVHNADARVGQAKDQFDWLRQVAFDSELPSAASRVAIALTKYFNYREHGGWAWMAQPTLAQDLGLSVRTVGSAISDLIARGHLITKRRSQDTSLYHLALNNGDSDQQEFADHDQQETADQNEVIGKNPQSVRQNRVNVFGKDLPTNPTNEPKKEPKKKKDSPPGLDFEGGDGVDPIESSFEIWWRQYPKHADKSDALRAYRAVIKKKLATPELLLEAAMRYAAERSGQQDHPKYTKNPATWLNKGSWANEPAKPVGNTVDNNGVPIRPPQQQPKYGGQFMEALAHAQRLKAQGGVQ